MQLKPLRVRLLLLLCLAAGPALAQRTTPPAQEAPAPFKRANVVVIHTADSVNTAYQKVAQALLAAGYTIDRADKELHFINTKARPLSRMGIQETIQVALRPVPGGTEAALSGSFASPALAAMSPLSAGDSRVEYKGMKGSAIMACWDELQRVAALYPGGTLTYKQQP